MQSLEGKASNISLGVHGDTQLFEIRGVEAQREAYSRGLQPKMRGTSLVEYAKL